MQKIFNEDMRISEVKGCSNTQNRPSGIGVKLTDIKDESVTLDLTPIGDIETEKCITFQVDSDSYIKSIDFGYDDNGILAYVIMKDSKDKRGMFGGRARGGWVAEIEANEDDQIIGFYGSIEKIV